MFEPVVSNGMGVLPVSDNNVEEFRRKLKAYRKTAGRLPIQTSLGPVYEPYPKPRRSLFARIPWGSLVLILMLGLCLKAFVVLRIGEDQIRQRLAAYQEPGLGEKIGLLVMTPDLVTRALSFYARPVINGQQE